LTRWAALTAELAKITQPALVASGHRDIMAPAINSYILAQHIPDAQLITYPDSDTVEVDVEPGTKVHCRAGDVASFKKGATSQWNIMSDDYKEVFIYAF
jgi:hypothetical protein